VWSSLDKSVSLLTFSVFRAGISATYATVGGMFVTLAALNALLLNETKAISAAHAPHTTTAQSTKGNNTTTTAVVAESTTRGVLNSFNTAYAAWKVLITDPNVQIRHTVTMNGLVWFALSGTQMTLLPLLMVGPLHMSAAEIGGSFAFMSLVSFLFSQPMAYLADKYGKVPTMLGGCGLLSCSMMALPLTTNPVAIELLSLPALTGAIGVPLYTPALLAVLLPFSLGSTALNATPTALMSDLTEPASRAQALSLLRTAGDLGLLLGIVMLCAANLWCCVACICRALLLLGFDCSVCSVANRLPVHR
jgi:hypothetical protein